jgi:hypothetical protein
VVDALIAENGQDRAKISSLAMVMSLLTLPNTVGFTK